MHRRTVLAASSLLVTTGAATAANQGFVLVTEAQARAERDRVPSDSDAPVQRTRAFSFPSIKVVAPQATEAALASPLRIEVVFETSSDARILPDSFRLLYGMLRINLTDNVRENATLTEKGLVAEKAEVPKGNHRLFLQVKDSLGRMAEQELRVKVG